MVNNRITSKWLTYLLLAATCILVLAPFSAAQNLPRTVTIAYSNNINGEVDPCPT